MTLRADDALKYAAAILTQRTDWTLNAIGGSDCSIDHEAEIEATYNVVEAIREFANQFGDPRRYSDGRLVKSTYEIQPGFVGEHVWLPDPALEKPASHRGALPSGHPDAQSPGIYKVTCAPATQDIHVRVVRAV